MTATDTRTILSAQSAVRPRPRRSRGDLGFTIWGIAVLVFLFLPIAVVVVYSFNVGRLLTSLWPLVRDEPVDDRSPEAAWARSSAAWPLRACASAIASLLFEAPARRLTRFKFHCSVSSSRYAYVCAKWWTVSRKSTGMSGFVCRSI